MIHAGKILILLLLFSIDCSSQDSKSTLATPMKGNKKSERSNYRNRPLEDSLIFFVVNGACKNKLMIISKKQISDPPVEEAVVPDKVPLLSIHGNILYNFNYRSYIDTPFAQSGLIQHTVQTFMNGDISGKYPFRAIFTYRGSNSPYFSNASGISIQYRQPDMQEKIKTDLRKDADSSLNKSLMINPSKKYTEKQADKTKDSLLRALETNPYTKGLYKKYDSLYKDYESKRKLLEALQKKTGNRNILQELIEARESKLFKKESRGTDSTTDSSGKKAPSDIWSWAEQKEVFIEKANPQKQSAPDSTSKKPDSTDEAKINKTTDSISHLKKEVSDAEKKILLFQKGLGDSVLLAKKKINQLNDPQSLTDYIDKQDTVEKNRLTPAQRFLLSVDQIGIGRSWISYSELTVKNISLNGFNVEMNPGNLYMAAAIGSVNSQFKDFILNNNTSVNQSVRLLRLGAGRKNKNNVIFTMYSGRKAMLNATGLSDSFATQAIMGASLATTVAVDKNTSATVEFARSSYEDAYSPGRPNKGLFNRVLNFKMNANQAWDIKFQSIYPLSNTKISGDYRQMGEAFQSFTIYASNVKQDAYSFHVNQLLWKKKLSIDASVRKNDFNSPLTAPGYSNTAVFKSLQASLSIPHYPFVSIGYYPSSQLFAGSNNIIYQSWYNTFNAIASHTYKWAGLDMNSNMAYTRFYNTQPDSSFIYFNSSSFTASHSVYIGRFMLQGNLTITNQEGLHLRTVEPLATYQYKNIFSLTGSVKWTRLNGMQTLWGGTAGMGVLVKHVGSIQLHYDKVYLPAYNRSLMPVDMGRVTYNREF
jgi:hypothetical protein